MQTLTPVHTKCSRLDKNHYRPVSILPNLSKNFELYLFKQISNYFESIFSKFQCGFNKGCNAKHCFPALLESSHIGMDIRELFGALLTGFSEDFECQSHDLFS